MLEMGRRPFFIVGSLLSKKGMSELYALPQELIISGEEKYLSKDENSTIMIYQNYEIMQNP